MLTTDADEDKVQGDEDEDEDEDDDSWLKAINKCIQKVSTGTPKRLMHLMQTMSPEEADIYSQDGPQFLVQEGDVGVQESNDLWNIAK